MKTTFVHLCDHAMLSQEGKLSVIGIFNRIAMKTIEIPFHGFFIAFEIEVNYAEVGQPFPARIEIMGDRGEKVFEAQAEVNVKGQSKPGENPRFAQIVPVQNIKFTRTGAYFLSIFLNGVLQEAQQLTLYVLERDASDAAPA